MYFFLCDLFILTFLIYNISAIICYFAGDNMREKCFSRGSLFVSLKPVIMKKDCLDYGFDLYVAFVDGKPVECGESRVLLEKSYSLMLKKASLKRHKIEIHQCFCTILEKPKIDDSPMFDFLDLDNPEDEAFAASYDRYLENRANPILDPDNLPF